MPIHRILSLACLIAALTPMAAAQQMTIPIWSHGAPETTAGLGPEKDVDLPTDALIAGKKIIRLTNVSEPTVAVYKADGNAPAPAVLVLPGGGYQILAYDLEGTEVCSWLNSIHITCVLLKYRVPYDGHYPERTENLEDAQQAMRLTRQHAAEWGIDPKRLGVLGFSAGGHLAVVLSNHFDFAPDATKSATLKQHGALDASISARPDFAFIIYPGYLVHWPDKSTIAPEAIPNASTPPTFILQAEDDPVHEENALVYFQTLKDGNIPAELHLYAKGGHGYGLRPTELPITHWPQLAETWLRTIKMIDAK
ncbi:acetyl esterase/lipase [Granulicella aggregans]|uniref:Acetyl esterase/lipase n=1 Tax=Granulicella aggregans TaxID=474949 RepID=A0A7W7ZDI9_9BACT|nr:acetyl esterase/lipase [Granulicella aggregans]